MAKKSFFGKLAEIFEPSSRHHKADPVERFAPQVPSIIPKKKRTVTGRNFDYGTGKKIRLKKIKREKKLLTKAERAERRARAKFNKNFSY
jgi:hypothetical protein